VNRLQTVCKAFANRLSCFRSRCAAITSCSRNDFTVIAQCLHNSAPLCSTLLYYTPLSTLLHSSAFGSPPCSSLFHSALLFTTQSLRELGESSYCANVSQSLDPRFANGLQTLHSRAIVVQSLCNRCAIAVKSLCNRCAIAVKSLCNRCAIAVQPL
jgi:hypothetical protein